MLLEGELELFSVRALLVLHLALVWIYMEDQEISQFWWIRLYRFQGYPLFSMVLLWVGPLRLNVSWKLAATPFHFHHWTCIIAAFQLTSESGCWISLRFQQSSRVSALQACSNCLGTTGWVMHLLMWHRTIACRLGSSISGMHGTFQLRIPWNSHMLPFVVMRAGVLTYHQLPCQTLTSWEDLRLLLCRPSVEQ